MTRLAAALALGVALLLPAAPAAAAIEVPDPEYAGAVFVSGPAGLVLLDEMEGGVRVGIALSDLPRVRAMLLGDAPCSEGGGEPILRMGFPIGVGVTVRWPELPEIGRIGSFWLQETNGTTTCLDAEHQALVWRS